MCKHQAETVNSGSAEPDRVNTREGNKSNHSAQFSLIRLAKNQPQRYSITPPSSRQATFFR